MVDEECVITVDTQDAGQGNITCRIRTPTDTDADIDIVDNNDGTAGNTTEQILQIVAEVRENFGVAGDYGPLISVLS